MACSDAASYHIPYSRGPQTPGHSPLGRAIKMAGECAKLHLYMCRIQASRTKPFPSPLSKLPVLAAKKGWGLLPQRSQGSVKDTLGERSFNLSFNCLFNPGFQGFYSKRTFTCLAREFLDILPRNDFTLDNELYLKPHMQSSCLTMQSCTQ